MRLKHVEVKAPLPPHLQGKELYVVNCQLYDDARRLLGQDPDAMLTQAWYPYNQISLETIQRFQQKDRMRWCTFIYAVDASSSANSAIYMSHDVTTVVMDNHKLFKYQIRI